MSFLMEHYELTVNLVVRTTYSGMPSFYFIVLGLGSCKSKLYYLYGFWEMKAVLVFFSIILLSITGLGWFQYVFLYILNVTILSVI